MFTRSYYSFSEIGRLSYHNTKIKRVAFTMQFISKKFQLGQIAFLTENREGINATLLFN